MGHLRRINLVRAESEPFRVFPALRRFLSGGWLCALLFVALGSVFVSRTGVEEDEALAFERRHAGTKADA